MDMPLWFYTAFVLRLIPSNLRPLKYGFETNFEKKH
jgi:hypothetical protein